MPNQKRYVAVIPVYVYGENAQEAFQEANKICQAINNHDGRMAEVEKMLEKPYGKINLTPIDISQFEE